MPPSSKLTPMNDYEVAAQLRSVVVPLARSLRQQTGGELTATQSSVLGSVARHGPISLSELASREQLSLPMISKVVANLEGRDLVTRVDDPDDGRVCLAEISPHGGEWLAASRERRDRWLAERLAALDGDACAAIAAAIPWLQCLIDEPA